MRFYSEQYPRLKRLDFIFVAGARVNPEFEKHSSRNITPGRMFYH